jgi:MerR family transcriptional regulator, light-induced transcriptional regulator
MSGPRPVEQPKSAVHSKAHVPRPLRTKPVSSVTNGLVFPPQVREVVEPLERTSPHVAGFIKALLAPDDELAAHFAHELLDEGLSAETLYEEVFTPAARVLGDMWCADDCTFYDVTIGTGRIQRLIRDLSHQFLADQAYPGSAGRVLLSCAPGEQHSLGIAMLAEYMVRDGWDVQLGQGVGSEGLLDNVRENDYNLLGFSVAVTDHLSKLQQDVRRLRQVSRNRDIRVLVGGQLICADPSLVRRIGADGYATDARAAVREARRLLLA